ncbi:UAP56-interacting factor like [Actinidia chinensis var. chinensis]|uniref:UAP56-interacting factor like n=1 Tax=Actinidia chinensis var. chinensis TaxID=1590841 RepID=A0A2R6QN02_ACTCC|nr:UAP56-interacting factor like [Actinidia chinensis var. chinensis]
MAAKPLTTERIALTEKKMDMTLDDIIKMSKNNTSKTKTPRVSNRSQKFLNNGAQEKTSKVRRFMDSRSSMRQGVLAQRRSNFKGNQFPLATEAARKAAVAPIRNRAFNRGWGFDVNKPRVRAPPVQRKAANGRFTVKPQPQAQPQPQPQPQVNLVPKQRPQTLDAMFANMKEQRMRALSHQNNGGRRNGSGQQQRQQWGRGRFGN